jgi:hypothetical protein
VSFSQVRLIANFNAHYLDNNALSRTELSAVQPRLRAHLRRRNLHDAALIKAYSDPPKLIFRYIVFCAEFFSASTGANFDKNRSIGTDICPKQIIQKPM